jgi:RNA polymerase sigma factor (sigma-70 family)
MAYREPQTIDESPDSLAEQAVDTTGPLLDPPLVSDSATDFADPEAQTQEISPDQLVEAKTLIKAARDSFDTGGKIGHSPFRLMPNEIIKSLVFEALDRDPFQVANSLTLELNGELIELSYDALSKFQKHTIVTEAITEYLSKYLCTFERVCEYLSKPNLARRYGGFAVVRKWWPEIIERAFRQQPFSQIADIFLVHNGKTVHSPYNHARDLKDPSEALYVEEIYSRVYRKYVNESYDHVMAYLFRPTEDFTTEDQKAGKKATVTKTHWEVVDEKWRKQFMRECFHANPFSGQLSALGMQKNGRFVRVPFRFYCNQGKSADFDKMMTEIVAEYLSTFEGVVAYITGGSLGKSYGGWNIVPEKFKRLLIINAVLQSKEEVKSIKRLIYTGKNGVQVSLTSLHNNYQTLGLSSRFSGYVNEGFERKKLGQHLAIPPQAEEATSKRTVLEPETDEERAVIAQSGWVLEPIPHEEVMKLIEAAQDGDIQSKFKVIQTFAKSIRALARKTAKNNDELFRELEGDGIVKAETCVMKFDTKRGLRFSNYLYKALKHHFAALAVAYATGRSLGKTRTTGNVLGKLRKATEDSGINLTDMSAEEVARLTGCKVETVLNHQRQLRTHESLEAPVGDDDDFTLGSTISDTTKPKALDRAEENHRRAVISDSLEDLGLKQQIIAKLHSGIAGRITISPYYIQNIFNGAVSTADIIAMVDSFQQSLKKHLLKRMETAQGSDVTSLDLERLLNILNASEKSEETMNGVNPLGKDLLSGLDVALRDTVIRVLYDMPFGPQTIILSQIYNIPLELTHEEIGTCFGCTGSNIGQMLEKIYACLRKPLMRYKEAKPANIQAETSEAILEQVA